MIGATKKFTVIAFNPAFGDRSATSDCPVSDDRAAPSDCPVSSDRAVSGDRVAGVDPSAAPHTLYKLLLLF